MGYKFWNSIRGMGRAAFVAGLTAALIVVSGGIARAQSENSAAGNGPAGAWLVEVTLRNCDTGAALGPPGHSLVTFHRGGTVSETVGAASFAIGQRSPGHGVWNHVEGRVYSQRFVNLLRFDTPPNLPGMPGFDPSLPISPGFFAGWQVVRHTLEMTDADNFASTGTNAFFKLDGTQYRTGCSTAAGRRFQ